jgi:hypothetical protein
VKAIDIKQSFLHSCHFHGDILYSPAKRVTSVLVCGIKA